jgi:hypothetical protein
VQAPVTPEQVATQSFPEHPVSLEDVSIEERTVDCPVAPCDVLYTMNGRVVNHLPAAVSNIELAVGLYWTVEGMLPLIPAYASVPTNAEEVVSLGNSAVPGKGSKLIRVNIDRKIPVVPGGRFIPHLRVVGFVAEEL